MSFSSFYWKILNSFYNWGFDHSLPAVMFPTYPRITKFIQSLCPFVFPSEGLNVSERQDSGGVFPLLHVSEGLSWVTALYGRFFDSPCSFDFIFIVAVKSLFCAFQAPPLFFFLAIRGFSLSARIHFVLLSDWLAAERDSWMSLNAPASAHHTALMDPRDIFWLTA